MPSEGVNGDERVGDAITDEEEQKSGSSCKVMKLWEDRTPDDHVIWVTEPPERKPKSIQPAGSPKYVITLRYGGDEDSAVHTLKSIVIRGPELYRLLEEFVKRISSHFDEAEHGIVMHAPFRLLFWGYDHIKAAARSTEPKLREAAILLRDVLDEEFKTLMSKRTKLLTKQETTFASVWTLFPPGSTCITNYKGKIVAVKVLMLEFKVNSFGPNLYQIHHQMLEWDGKHFGWTEGASNIAEFNGRQRIEDLSVYPIEFSSNPQLPELLRMRGNRFVELVLKEPYMMSFCGETLDSESSGLWWQVDQRKKMSERVVLDAQAYDHYHRRIKSGEELRPEILEEARKGDNGNSDLFMFCCTELHCFALHRKEWTRVWVDDLAEVSFSASAYESLVLPHDYKKLLLAFAEAQLDNSSFDDVIAGKGQGILMLLAGPPGTGKTLTAEAMAEHMQRPLYSLSAGEISAGKGSMEFKLDRVLQLATRWNAILLLDEADVWLERRTDNDLERNTVVSIFLKKLEYYQGIMFLTTNRIASFDEAFRSRIHVAIQYPDLDASSRSIIWKTFLKRTEEVYTYGVKLSDAEVDEISQKSLNGREIRNLIKAAQLLASRAKEPLQKYHIDIVWRVEREESPWLPR